MLNDNIKMKIAGKTVKDFISFEAPSNLLQAGDNFNAEIDVDHNVKEFDKFELYINDKLEMTGIIDIIESAYDKNSKRLTVSGKDLMGLVVDSYCTERKTFKDISLVELAKELFKDNDHLRQSSIKMVTGNKDKNITAIVLNPILKDVQIKPGQTIFNVLNEHAQKKGFIFFYEPDGTFCFGQFLKTGAPEFILIHEIDGNGKNNNIINAKLTKNSSKLYSEIWGLAQLGLDFDLDIPLEKYNHVISIENSAVTIHKPFVTVVENIDNEIELADQCALIFKKQKYESFKLKYRVSGLQQNGNTYQVNKIASVTDKDKNFNFNKKLFLILSRTLRGDKTSGYHTDLILTPLEFL